MLKLQWPHSFVPSHHDVLTVSPLLNQYGFCRCINSNPQPSNTSFLEGSSRVNTNLTFEPKRKRFLNIFDQCPYILTYLLLFNDTQYFVSLHRNHPPLYWALNLFTFLVVVLFESNINLKRVLVVYRKFKNETVSNNQSVPLIVRLSGDDRQTKMGSCWKGLSCVCLCGFLWVWDISFRVVKDN